MSIEDLIKKISEYLSPKEVETVQKAYQFAKEAHDGQYRKSGRHIFITRFK